jgi:ATP-binding cassette subfamily B protein
VARRVSTRFHIADPAGEKYQMTKEELMKCWANNRKDNELSGIALLLEPTPDFYNQEDEEKSQKKLTFFLNYLTPHKSQFIQLVIGLIIGSILSLIFPFLTQSIVDQGINNQNLPFVTLILIAQLVLFCSQLGVEFIRNWISLHVNTRISISLISDFLSKLMKLPLRFFDSKNVGDIMQRIGDNVRIKTFLTGSALTTLFSFANFLIFACVLGYYNLSILAVFFVGNALYVAWIMLFLRYRRKMQKSAWNV